MSLPPVVEEVVGAYLEMVDAAVPGLVEGLYLVGSAALGDFCPRTSDIDYLAVTAARPEPTRLTALERVHDRLRKRAWPYFDGRYVTWEDLGRPPELAGPGPSTHEGRFHPRSDGPCDPVTWHTLARHGVACRGHAPTQMTVWTDPQALTAWTLSNLDSYWRKLVQRAEQPRTLWRAAALTPYTVVWIVTGVSRMHYTLTTGEICSKQDAGRYAQARFSQRWHRIIVESLRIRRADYAGAGIAGAVPAAVKEFLLSYGAERRSLYRSPWTRRGDVLAFADMVIVDAQDHAVR